MKDVFLGCCFSAMACMVFQVVACGGALPQTDCAANPAYTTRAQVDACRAAVVAKDGGTHG